MKRILWAMIPLASLAGCGLGETAVTAAAEGAAQAEQVKQGLKTEARVRNELDAAAKVDADRRQAAETAAQ